MKRNTLTLVVGGALAAAVLGAAPAALAHHTSAYFDMTKQVIYKGAVKKWLWVNPHSFLYVEVKKADGTSELWGFETGGPNVLVRAGWKASSMKPGDTVTVYAAPERHGKHNAMLQKVILSNGKILNAGPGAPPPGAGPGAPPALPPMGGPAPTPVEYK